MQQVTDILKQVAPYLNQIAPYLIIAVYVAAGILAIAVLSFLARVFSGAGNGLLKCSSRLLILFGTAFLIYQGLDIMAGTGGGASFAFHQQPLWMVTAVLLASGVLFRLISALRPTH